MDDYEKKITDTTKEACALIGEKLPSNRFIVAIFHDDEEERSYWHTFKGHMDTKALIALACGTINTLAEEVGMTRDQIMRILMENKDPIMNMEDLK